MTLDVFETWLSAPDARSLMLERGPFDHRIGARLFRTAADGTVRTRVRLLLINERRRFENVDLPAELWRKLRSHPIREDWPCSSFEGQRFSSLGRNDNIRLVGLQFNERDLRSLLGLPATEPVAVELTPTEHQDLPLVKEMLRQVEAKETKSLHRAAQLLALQAEGGSEERRVKRLLELERKLRRAAAQ